MNRHWYSRSKLLVTFVFAMFAFYAVTSPVDAGPSAGVKLGAGTVVALALEHTIDSEMSVGTSVSFRVVYDVKADDKVVIRAGSIATGTISSVDGSSAVGQPGKVSIDLRSVKAVDGTDVMLRGNINKEGDDKVVLSVILALICLPLILINGGDAEVPAGTEVRAYVEQETIIQV
jgi:hypothetical protein